MRTRPHGHAPHQEPTTMLRAAHLPGQPTRHSQRLRCPGAGADRNRLGGIWVSAFTSLSCASLSRLPPSQCSPISTGCTV